MSWRRKLFATAMIRVILYFLVGFIAFAVLTIFTFKARRLIICGYMFYGIIITCWFGVKFIKFFFDDEYNSKWDFNNLDENKIITKDFDSGEKLKFAIIIPSDCAYIFKNCFTSTGFLKSREDWKKMVSLVKEVSLKATRGEMIKINFYEAELAEGVNLPYSESLEAFIFK